MTSADPLPDDWGRFDFVVCRELLGRAADPPRLLANLARGARPRGPAARHLPSHAGRQVARAFRRAVEALAPPGSGAAERADIGLELFHALRPDHPIRARVAESEAATDREPSVAGFLADCHDWTLDEAAAMLTRAGLKFLYAATPWRWRPDRVFAARRHPRPLRPLGLAPDRLSRLIDALDPTLLDDHYQILRLSRRLFSRPSRIGPSRGLDHPRIFERLVPELTGLAEPSSFLPCRDARTGLVPGGLGESGRTRPLVTSASRGRRRSEFVRRYREETLCPRPRRRRPRRPPGSLDRPRGPRLDSPETLTI